MSRAELLVKVAAYRDAISALRDCASDMESDLFTTEDEIMKADSKERRKVHKNAAANRELANRLEGEMLRLIARSRSS